MGEYEDRAKRHGLDVSFFQSLQTLRIEVPIAAGVDIGFSTSPATVLTRCFSGLRRYQIAPRLFVFGRHSKAVADILRDCERINSLLIYVLDNYAFSIELNNSTLTTRVNLMAGFPSRDGTDGEHLFSALSEIAGELRLAHLADSMPAKPTGNRWGPARIRTISIICAGLSPLLAVILLFAWFIHHSPSLLHR
ncbi:MULTISPECIES: hypothetical protein [Paraburkholderia]|uniref:hypothetical protein n=1 Tax=Paraburkholderia TaxID=1822464 RepID=UPI002AB607E8|nr:MULTISPECIES: hypothetical protein [Paraburkholderia]